MLQQRAVPAGLVGRSYADLIAFCLLGGAGDSAACRASFPPGWLPLGLLRKKTENRAWRLPFVAVHPEPSTLLLASDKIFLLRSRGAQD
jgi:hypothetical protein